MLSSRYPGGIKSADLASQLLDMSGGDVGVLEGCISIGLCVEAAVECPPPEPSDTLLSKSTAVQLQVGKRFQLACEKLQLHFKSEDQKHSIRVKRITGLPRK